MANLKKSSSAMHDQYSQAKLGDGSFEDRLLVCLGEVEVALLKAKKAIMQGVSLDATMAKQAIDRFVFSMATNSQVRMSSSVHCLKITVRQANSLERAGYKTIGALVGANVSDLQKIPLMGEVAIKSIRDALAEHSMCLRSDREGAKEFRTMDPEILLERERNSQGYAW